MSGVELMQEVFPAGAGVILALELILFPRLLFSPQVRG